MLDIPFIVLDSLAIFLVLVPMPWHLSAWNSATCFLMIWTVMGCIILLTNSIIWHDSLANPYPTYCDIATKILMGISVAIPLSSLCINRRLYKIATTQTVIIDKASKRRNVITDTIIAVLLPLIFMAVHYTQQGHRYDIVENYGCWPTTYLTALGYLFVIVPPILVCSISLVYCTLSIRAFLKRRQDFNDILRNSAGLNPHRYFRLMALASTEIVIGLPSSLFFLITNLKATGVEPWISWADTHYDFNRVSFFPKYFFEINTVLRVGFELNRWAFPFIAFSFFAFFGLADEARRNYRAAFYAVGKLFGVKPPSTTTSLKGGSFIQAFVHRTVRRSHTDCDEVSLPYYSKSPLSEEKVIQPARPLSRRLSLSLGPPSNEKLTGVVPAPQAGERSPACEMEWFPRGTSLEHDSPDSAVFHASPHP